MDTNELSEQKEPELICPKCGRKLFHPFGDPEIVWCTDMGHWAGLTADLIHEKGEENIQNKKSDSELMDRSG